MSYDSQRNQYGRERIQIVEIDVPQCVNTFQSSPCVGGTWTVTTTAVGTDDFAVNDEIEGGTSGALGVITEISGTSPTYTFTYRSTNGINFQTASETITSNTRTGSATKNGSAPSSASTGDEKCYNTLASCTDLINYDHDITSGAISIDVNSSNKTFTRGSGSFITDGFEVGMTITTTGFATSNSQFVIDSITALIITVTDNFELTTESGSGDEVITATNKLAYKFCQPRSPHPQGMNNYFPCITNVNVAPSKINPRGGVGGRTSLGVSFNDFPSSDRNGIDPYLSDRTFDPFEVGSFWTKWRARNAFYENYPVRHLSGYIVDNAYDESNFQIRYYTMGNMTATNGQASITAKDPIQKITNKRALAPTPSEGTLDSGITAGATSLTLTSGTEGEYPTGGGKLCIRDEVILYTSRSGTSVTGLTRGANNTTADAHDSGDTVQLVLEYSGQGMDTVLADLMETYAEIEPIYLDKAGWQTQVDTYLSGNPNAVIPKPTPVDKLINELTEQWPSRVYWDDRSAKIKLSAIRAPSSGNSLTQQNNFVDGSFSVKDRPELQLSSVYVLYGQYDPTKKLDEEDNYQITYARPNTSASFRYGSNNTKKVYSRWINTSSSANARLMAGLLGRRFGFVPREVKFALDAKDSDTWLATNRTIEHRDISDFNGNIKPSVFEIISAKEDTLYQYTGLEYLYDDELPEDEGGGDPNVDLVFLDSDEPDLNLYDRYVENFSTPGASTDAKFIVDATAVIFSTSTSTPAIETGTWPVGAVVTLQVNSGCFVVGKGGQGGDDGSDNGSAGGDAINLSNDLTIVNNGVIGGGGGGGGGVSDNYSSSGGGGGSGFGLAGASNSYSGGVIILPAASDASDGSTSTSGQGGLASYAFGGSTYSITGGDGGALGASGVAGIATGGFPTVGASSGGAAGKAIELNGNSVTYTVEGDIRGTVS